MLSPPSIDIAQPSTSCGSADGQWPTERPLGEDLCSTYLQPEPWNPRLPLYLEDLASARQQWHCNQAARSHSYSRLIKMCHFASQRCELEVLCPKLRYTWVWLVTGWKFSEHGRIYKSYQQWPTEELRERSRSQNGLEGEPLEVPSQKKHGAHEIEWKAQAVSVASIINWKFHHKGLASNYSAAPSRAMLVHQTKTWYELIKLSLNPKLTSFRPCKVTPGAQFRASGRS
jgi:hypothetical protein